MPPPPPDVTSYLNILQRDMAQRSAEAEEVRRLRREIEIRKLEMELAALSSPTQLTKPTRRPSDFYEQQINAWFNRLPPEARKAPRSMEEFLNLLEGRTPRMRAHAPEVSRALTAKGWVRQRNWKVDGGGRRLWWPPTNRSLIQP